VSNFRPVIWLILAEDFVGGSNELGIRGGLETHFFGLRTLL